MTTASKYCDVCEQQRMVQKEDVNHVLHLLMALFTCGFWVLVWGFLCVVNWSKDYRCTACGSKV